MTPHNMAKIDEHPRHKFCLKTLPYSRVLIADGQRYAIPLLTVDCQRPPAGADGLNFAECTVLTGPSPL